MKWHLKQLTLGLAALCAVATVSAGTAAAAAPSAPTSGKAHNATIRSIAVEGEGEHTALLITLSAPVTYTSYKTTGPARLVLDLAQAQPAEGMAATVAGRGPFTRVTIKRYDTDAGTLTRMEIELAQDLDPVISPLPDKEGVLKVTFPGYQPPPVTPPAAAATPAVAAASAPAAAPAATASSQPVITGVVPRGGGIAIQMTGGTPAFRQFRLNKPDRLVIDIPAAMAAPDLKIVSLNTAGVATARIGTSFGKVRVVLDLLTDNLNDAVVEPTADGLLVRFPATLAIPGRKQPQPAAAAAAAKAAPAAVVQTQPVASPPPVKLTPVVPAEPVAKVMHHSAPPQVKAIDFQVLDGLTRITITASGSPVVDEPVKSAGFVSLRIKNALLPNALRRSFETRNFNTPVLRITPIQVHTRKETDTIIRVAMRADAPFQLRREADVIYLEFRHPARPASFVHPAAHQEAPAAAASPASSAMEKQLTDEPTVAGKRIYTGRKVTLEFADADVRKIFQLLSEVSNKNFVLGDEVGGTISLKLVNVPWDQALDIILDTKNLDKREEGNIILIRGKGKFKSLLDEEVDMRKAALKSEPLETAMFDVNYADLNTIVDQFKALKTDRGTITADARTNKVIVKDVKDAVNDMRTLLKSLDVPERQVMIEARIVEATSTFTRSLGVNWGIHYRDGSASIAGINSMDTSFGGLTSTVPPSTGVSGQPGASAGISFGTLASNIKLDMRLNAAVSAGLVRIVSTPRVATLNHKAAKITQGQQIPYTSSTSDKVQTQFVEAALSLEVTPNINPNGTIVMKIDAKNDAPGSSVAGGTIPAINKKEATTEMMLRDGETTVIGGIYVERDTNSDDGVPFLQDIPFLGGLFKSNSVEKTRTELLIFITPRILNNNV